MTYAERGDLSGLPPSSRGPSTLLGGFGDLRITPRLALLRQEWSGIDLATQVSLEVPTARSQTLTDDGRVRVEGLVALGRRLGATVCPVRNLAIDLAGGGALTDGIGAPRARFLLGFGWSPSSCGSAAPLPQQLAAAAPPPAPAPAIVPAPPPPPVPEQKIVQ